MKHWRILLGAILILYGLIQGGRYVLNQPVQTNYGYGFLFGITLITLVGGALLYAGLKRSART